MGEGDVFDVENLAAATRNNVSAYVLWDALLNPIADAAFWCEVDNPLYVLKQAKLLEDCVQESVPFARAADRAPGYDSHGNAGTTESAV